MKALIICSVYALSDISQLEREACNRACERNGIPAVLTTKDHARIVATTTMLDALNQMPGSMQQREALINNYLDILNDEIWSGPLHAYQSVFAALLHPKGYARPTGFVSDYPMLTTNLVRSSALLTNATKLGTLTALTDPLKVQSIAASLAASATSLNVANCDVEVLVAHRRDFIAAQSIGMHPRFIEELQPLASSRKELHKSRTRVPTGAIINSAVISQPVAVPA